MSYPSHPDYAAQQPQGGNPQYQGQPDYSQAQGSYPQYQAGYPQSGYPQYPQYGYAPQADGVPATGALGGLAALAVAASAFLPMWQSEGFYTGDHYEWTLLNAVSDGPIAWLGYLGVAALLLAGLVAAGFAFASMAKSRHAKSAAVTGVIALVITIGVFVVGMMMRGDDVSLAWGSFVLLAAGALVAVLGLTGAAIARNRVRAY